MSELTKQLREVGVYNAHDFAGKGNVYIVQISGDKWHCARFEVVRPEFFTDDDAKVRQDVYNPYKCFSYYNEDSKKATFDTVKNWTEEKYGIKEWVKTPFGTWMDKEFVKKRLKELKEQIKRKEDK